MNPSKIKYDTNILFRLNRNMASHLKCIPFFSKKAEKDEQNNDITVERLTDTRQESLKFASKGFRR